MALLLLSHHREMFLIVMDVVLVAAMDFGTF